MDKFLTFFTEILIEALGQTLRSEERRVGKEC